MAGGRATGGSDGRNWYWLGALLALVGLALPVWTWAAPEAGAATPGAAGEPVLEESLGAPVRTARMAEVLTITKPGGGRYLLSSYGARKESPLQVCLVDLDTRTAKLHSYPQLTDWLANFVVGKDGRYYLAPYGCIGLFRFDPASGQLDYLPSEIPGRLVQYQMQVAGDGRIYMGTASAQARLIEFDPGSKAFRDLGVQGPDLPAPRYVFSMTVSDDYVYSAAGKNPWYLVATQRQSGKQQVLLETKPDYLDVTRGYDGKAYARATYHRGQPQQRTEYLLLEAGQAKAVPGIPPASPEQIEEQHRQRKEQADNQVEVLLDKARPDSQGRAEYWWRLPGQTQWQSVPITGIQVWPWTIEAVGLLPDGRIMGLPEAYEDAFVYDPASGKSQLLGKSPLSAYALATAGNKTYLLGYPGTQVYAYDSARPWTYYKSTPQQKEPPLTDAASNPRRLAGLGEWIQTHHPRGWAVGRDGALYVAGHAERLNVGGGIAWWDPTTEKAGGLREPFLVHDCAPHGLAANAQGTLLIYSSLPVADPKGQVPTPDGGKLFFFDVASRTISGEMAPLPKLRSTGSIVVVGERVFGVARTADKQHVLYSVDLASRTLVGQQSLADPSASNLVVGKDGQIFAILGKQLCRIQPQSLQVTKLGAVAAGGQMLLVNDDLYLAGTPELRRIKTISQLTPAPTP